MIAYPHYVTLKLPSRLRFLGRAGHTAPPPIENNTVGKALVTVLLLQPACKSYVPDRHPCHPAYIILQVFKSGRDQTAFNRSVQSISEITNRSRVMVRRDADSPLQFHLAFWRWYYPRCRCEPANQRNRHARLIKEGRWCAFLSLVWVVGSGN